MSTIRVCALENEAIADLVSSVLRKKRIPYTVISTHDSVLDGIGEGQLDWGYIEAPEEYADRIREIVSDLSPRDVKLDVQSREPQKKRLNARAKIVIALAPLVLLLIAYSATIALNDIYKSYFYNNVAVIFSRISLRDQAIGSYGRAIRANPQFAGAYRGRAHAFRLKGDLDNAIVDYSAAIKLEPLQSGSYFGRALARAAQHDLDGAISDYSKVIELNPRDEFAYMNRGVVWAKEGNSVSALSDYDKAISLDPRDSLAYYNRALLSARKGDLAAAVRDLTTVLELNPNDTVAYQARAYVWKKMGMSENAAKDQAKAEQSRKGR
jgi:tetratricopeptide (TPR) repeat protein